MLLKACQKKINQREAVMPPRGTHQAWCVYIYIYIEEHLSKVDLKHNIRYFFALIFYKLITCIKKNWKQATTKEEDTKLTHTSDTVKKNSFADYKDPPAIIKGNKKRLIHVVEPVKKSKKTSQSQSGFSQQNIDESSTEVFFFIIKNNTLIMVTSFHNTL